MKIALAGDGINLTTSYGKINREMALWLVKHGYDVYSFALQYNGEPVKLANGITLCSFADQNAMARSFEYAKPDVVLHLRDLWIHIPRFYRGMVYHLMPIASAYNSKILNYCSAANTELITENGRIFASAVRVGMPILTVLNDKLTFTPVKSLSRHNWKMLRIRTESSYIDVTAWTPLPVMRNGRILWLRADSVTEGDKLLKLNDLTYFNEEMDGRRGQNNTVWSDNTRTYEENRQKLFGNPQENSAQKYTCSNQAHDNGRLDRRRRQNVANEPADIRTHESVGANTIFDRTQNSSFENFQTRMDMLCNEGSLLCIEHEFNRLGIHGRVDRRRGVDRHFNTAYESSWKTRSFRETANWYLHDRQTGYRMDNPQSRRNAYQQTTAARNQQTDGLRVIDRYRNIVHNGKLQADIHQGVHRLQNEIDTGGYATFPNNQKRAGRISAEVHRFSTTQKCEQPLFRGRIGNRKTGQDIELESQGRWEMVQGIDESPERDVVAITTEAGTYIGNNLLTHNSPVQSLPLPKEYIQAACDEAHFTYTMTKWGMEGMIRQGVPAEKTDYLYHGCNFQTYKPVTAHRADYGLPEKGNMVMMVGMHLDYRKMHPLTLLAFSEYLKYDPSAFIYMHADVTGHYALDTHVEALGLAGRDKVFFKPGQGVSNLMTGVTDGQMNELLNVANVYCSLSGSEGFNLPAQEAAATGLPIVITDFFVHRELFGDYDGAYFVPAKKWLATPWGFEWIADPVAAAKLIRQAVRDGRRKPFRPSKFRWDNVMRKFLKRVDDILSE